MKTADVVLIAADPSYCVCLLFARQTERERERGREGEGGGGRSGAKGEGRMSRGLQGGSDKIIPWQAVDITV